MLSRWFATIVATAALVPCVGRAEVAGKWVAELTSPTLLEPVYIRVVLDRTGDAVTSAWGTEMVKGTVKGSTVSLTLADAGGRDAGTLTGKIEGDAGAGRKERWRAWDAGRPRRGWFWRTRSRTARGGAGS